MAVTISSELLDAIRAEAAADPAREVCGLLLGSGDRIEAITRCRNVAPDPARHFEIDPQALFVAIRAERGGGAQIIGHYHSHPSGLAGPSARDAADADADGRLWLIVAGAEVTAWRLGDGGRFAPVSLQVKPVGAEPVEALPSF